MNWQSSRRKPARLSPATSPCERDLAGVVGAAEHALTAEHLVEGYAVETASEDFAPLFARQPAFDRMRVLCAVKRQIARLDPAADPALRVLLARGSAGRDHLGEGFVAADPESVPAQNLGEAPR